MAVTETGQAGIAWETIVASLRNIHERGGWDITPYPIRYGQGLFVVLDLEQEELKLVDEDDVRDQTVLLEISAHTSSMEKRQMVIIGVSDLVIKEMSKRVNFLEEGAWIDIDVFTHHVLTDHVFTRHHVWFDSPNFVVEVTAKLVELLDNTLQYALPQLS